MRWALDISELKGSLRSLRPVVKGRKLLKTKVYKQRFSQFLIGIGLAHYSNFNISGISTVKDHGSCSLTLRRWKQLQSRLCWTLDSSNALSMTRTSQKQRRSTSSPKSMKRSLEFNQLKLLLLARKILKENQKGAIPQWLRPMTQV